MLRAGQSLAVCVVALLAIGVIMVQSAGLVVGENAPQTLGQLLLGYHARLAFLAIILLGLASRLPVRRISEYPLLILLLVAATIATLLLVYIPGIGHEQNGARRWITLGPLGFQASEIAKWSVPVVLAWVAARRPRALTRFFSGLVPPLIFLGAVAAAIALEDLGTAVLVGVVGAGVLLAGGARLRHIVGLVPVGLAAFAAFALSSPYRMKRLQTFLDPLGDPGDTSYHVIQSLAAVSGDGLGGRGLGNGLQKFGYLPEDTTDFIFAVICEEGGIVGACLVIFLIIALIASGWTIVRTSTHPFSRLLGFGILLTVAVQSLINLMVVTGLAPTKGIALPLVSAGGTGWCLTAASLGLIVAIERETRRTLVSHPCPTPHAPSSSPAAVPAVT